MADRNEVRAGIEVAHRMALLEGDVDHLEREFERAIERLERARTADRERLEKARAEDRAFLEAKLSRLTQAVLGAAIGLFTMAVSLILTGVVG